MYRIGSKKIINFRDKNFKCIFEKKENVQKLKINKRTFYMFAFSHSHYLNSSLYIPEKDL